MPAGNEQKTAPAAYIAVCGRDIIEEFPDSSSMDEYSRTCTDPTVLIYRLGTDALLDGHTEGCRS
jgi:hypothetical protein